MSVTTVLCIVLALVAVWMVASAHYVNHYRKARDWWMQRALGIEGEFNKYVSGTREMPDTTELQRVIYAAAYNARRFLDEDSSTRTDIETIEQEWFRVLSAKQRHTAAVAKIHGVQMGIQGSGQQMRDDREMIAPPAGPPPVPKGVQGSGQQEMARRHGLGLPTKDKAHPSYVTVTEGLRGWFAVMMSWTADETGGYYEPYHTGIGSFKTRAEAVVDAKQWAEAEGVEFKP